MCGSRFARVLAGSVDLLDILAIDLGDPAGR
jgi:hypothetical protein